MTAGGVSASSWAPPSSAYSHNHINTSTHTNFITTPHMQHPQASSDASSGCHSSSAGSSWPASCRPCMTPQYRVCRGADVLLLWCHEWPQTLFVCNACLMQLFLQFLIWLIRLSSWLFRFITLMVLCEVVVVVLDPAGIHTQRCCMGHAWLQQLIQLTRFINLMVLLLNWLFLRLMFLLCYVVWVHACMAHLGLLVASMVSRNMCCGNTCTIRRFGGWCRGFMW